METNARATFRNLYHLNSRLSDMFSRAYPTRTAGITRLQFRLLSVLDQNGPATMGELASRLKAHNSNLTPVVDQLYSEGFVTRIASQSDRRLVEISITESGSLLSRQLEERIANYLQNLPEQEKKEIKDALSKCAEML